MSVISQLIGQFFTTSPNVSKIYLGFSLAGMDSGLDFQHQSGTLSNPDKNYIRVNLTLKINIGS